MKLASRGISLTLSLFLSLGSISGVVNQMRPPVQSDFGGGGLQSPIYVNGVSGECFVYVNGTITPINTMNVMAFGAKGDGINDDTKAIQAAVDFVTAGGGVLFPFGTYKVTSQINVAKVIHLVGAGEFGTVLSTSSANAPILNVTTAGNVQISGFTMQSTTPRTGGYFIDINDFAVAHVYIQKVRFSAYWGGIRWAGVSTLDVYQCEFINGVTGSGIGIQIDNGGDISIRSCLWGSPAQIAAGILITQCQDVTLIDNNVIGGGNCLYLAAGTGKVIASLQATNCYFDTGTNGLVIDGAGTVLRAKFSACWFSSHTGRGILFNSGVGVVDDVVVFNTCEIYANGGSGFEINNGARAKNIAVVNCTIAGNVTGVLVGANMNNLRIESSRIGPAAGFAANTTGVGFLGAYDHTIVSGNDLSGNGTNVVIGTPGSNVIVAQNDGFVTANKGTATVASGTTSIVVNHGLGTTPGAADILVTPQKTLGAAAFYWVDTVTSTQFTIHTNANPGANVDFSWQARTLGA